jgi:hypothetical protein
VKQIRKRLTYANVMSSIAIFLVLGGATALAAGLAKNSVGTKQLKKNAVTTAKIKSNAVTTAKIRNGAVTGAKLNVGSIPTVPSAATAGNAGNANTVGGQSVTKLFTTLTEGQSGVLVGSVAGFSVIASCEANDANVEVTPPTATGWVMETGGVPGNVSEETTDDYDGGVAGASGSVNLDQLSAGGDATYGTATFYGATAGGTVVSGDIGYDYDTFDEVPPNTCIVAGHLIAG